MAEGVVSLLLMKLSECLEAEGRLLMQVREEAEYINDELEFMKAFLRAADAMEETDSVLKVLVKKVRDVAYDVEDALDDFRLRLAHEHGHGLSKLAFFVKKLIARHQIGSRFQSIKSRVRSISEQHRRYIIKNRKMKDSFSVGGTRVARRGDALLLEEKDLVGIETPKRHLMERLFDSRVEREVVSVVGMGGLGKSTLVKQVYDDPDVKKTFKFQVWITVSQSFNTEDLLRDMIQQLFHAVRKPEPRGMDTMDSNRLREVIHKFLRQRRYLVVFDDVWEISAWDAFEHALPNNNLGSRVLLTTRRNGVALSCSKFQDYVYNLDALSPEESWTLFSRKIFQNNPCPPHLKNVCDRILGRCEGLPLAIVAISGVLATKDQGRIDEWETVYRSLGAELGDNDKLKTTRKILSLSYTDLPYYLKSCLLYFSIFPEGNPIEHMRLVRLWIAEGFVKEKEGMTMEEVAEDYLNELIERNLVQIMEVTTYGRVQTCRIHDLLREIIISKAREQDFVAIAKEQCLTLPEKVRRISIHNFTSITHHRHIASRLRSLLMFWGVDSLYESPAFNWPFGRLRLLNVLDLEGAPLNEFPNEIFSLVLLKYLSLRDTNVSSVPSSIGKLLNLETLDLKNAYVTELPVEILKLQKLRHLLVYRLQMESDDQIHTKYGFKAPAEIGSLKSLQKLCFLEANQGNNLMVEVGKLSQLRRLGIVKLRKEDGKLLCTSISSLTNLRALSITSMEENEVIDLRFLSSPPHFLQRLYLTGCLEKLPDWISSLDSLVKVVLKWSQLSVDPLLSLQHLPNLVHLEFVQVYDGEELHFQGFQRLKFLGLNKLENLKMIMVEKGAMPHLEKLIVQNCKSLQRMPVGIEQLEELKVLEFFDMPRELLTAMHQNGEDADYYKVAHVPEVYFTSWNNGNLDIFSLQSLREDKDSAPPSPSTVKPRIPYIWK